MDRKSTLYEILGVERTASVTEIKRRFRELARTHHPDVANQPGAAAQFIAISEAYRTLSNPQLRAVYDSELILVEIRERALNERADSRTRPSTHPARPSPAASPIPREARRRSPAGGAPGSRSQDTEYHRAESLFRRMQLGEAESVCRGVIQRDRMNPAAYELLGDIQRARGRQDEALAMYSYAIQLDRTRRSAHVKIAQLTGGRAGPTLAGRSARGPRSRNPQHLVVRLAASSACLCALAWLIAMVAHLPPSAAAMLLPLDWDDNLLLALAAAGLFVGFALGIDGLIGRTEEELGGGTHRRSTPVGCMLVVFSLLFFYAAVAAYVMVASRDRYLSPSVLIAFGLTCMTVFALAVACGDGAFNVLLFGGNLVLPSLIFGWKLGQSVRPSSAVAGR